MISEPKVSTNAAEQILSPLRRLLRLSLQEMPHSRVNTAAKAGLICAKKSNIFCAKVFAKMYP